MAAAQLNAAVHAAASSSSGDRMVVAAVAGGGDDDGRSGCASCGGSGSSSGGGGGGDGGGGGGGASRDERSAQQRAVEGMKLAQQLRHAESELTKLGRLHASKARRVSELSTEMEQLRLETQVRASPSCISVHLRASPPSLAASSDLAASPCISLHLPLRWLRFLRPSPRQRPIIPIPMVTLTELIPIPIPILIPIPMVTLAE